MKQPMKRYLITFVAGEPDWAAVPQLQADQVLWKPAHGISAAGQICHDPFHLYVHLRADEKRIRAENTLPLSPVWQDSCLELFFMPENEDRYLNFEINPNGCLHIGFGRGREDRIVLFRHDMRELFGIRTGRTVDGWEAFYRIPRSFLRLFWPDFSFTGALRANVYKCGDLTEHDHYLSWNPVASAAPEFHRPQDFGLMVLE